MNSVVYFVEEIFYNSWMFRPKRFCLIARVKKVYRSFIFRITKRITIGIRCYLKFILKYTQLSVNTHTAWLFTFPLDLFILKKIFKMYLWRRFMVNLGGLAESITVYCYTQLKVNLILFNDMSAKGEVMKTFASFIKIFFSSFWNSII